MALGAIKGRANERRLVRRLLVQQVEDRALVRIERGDLQRVAVLDPADVDVVVEVEGPRRRGEIFRYWKLVLENTSVCDETATSSRFRTDSR